MIEYVLIIVSMAFMSTGLLLFKRFAVSLCLQEGLFELLKSLFNIFLLCAVIAFAASIVMNLLALSRLDLSVAYSFTGLTYIIVVLGARYFFGEKVNRYHVLGIAGITCGLFIFHRF